MKLSFNSGLTAWQKVALWRQASVLVWSHAVMHLSRHSHPGRMLSSGLLVGDKGLERQRAVVQPLSVLSWFSSSILETFLRLNWLRSMIIKLLMSNEGKQAMQLQKPIFFFVPVKGYCYSKLTFCFRNNFQPFKFFLICCNIYIKLY